MKFLIFSLHVTIFLLLFLFSSSQMLFAAEVSCADVDAYVLNSITFQNIPDARVGLRCTNGQYYCQGTDFQHANGACWENSGYKNVPPPPSSNPVFFSGYDCDKGGGQIYVELQAGWTYRCTTDGSRFDCSQGSNVDSDNLGLVNGAHNVIKIFYAPPIVPTPTPTPTPIPTPTPTPSPTPTPTTPVTPTPTPPCSLPQVANVRIECPFCISGATPTPTPTLTPTPTSIPTPTPIPSITPTPTLTPTPTPTPTVTPTPIPTPTGTLVPTPTPTITPVPSPTLTPSPTQVVYVTPTPRPTVAPTGDTRTPLTIGIGSLIFAIIGGILFLAL